jgi:small-conductance mechanosensitive channel
MEVCRMPDIGVYAAIIPFAVFIGFLLALLVLRKIMFRLLRGWAEKTETVLDDIIVATAQTPSIYLSVALALFVTIEFSAMPQRYLQSARNTILVIVIFSVTVMIANIAEQIFKNYTRQLNIPVPSTGLFLGVLKGGIIVVGLLVILGVLNVSIAPILTALGVGGLAVALALQDTLSNLFAGIHILIEKTIHVGDYIKLESGQEGIVEDISWRTTRIKMRPNNMVIIPNAKLAHNIVVNYNLPEKWMSVAVEVGVSYSSDPEEIERVLLEIAKEAVGGVPELLAKPAPVVRFTPGFGESSLNFTIYMFVREFIDQPVVQHEMRKRIFKRFKAEGIEIPFPQRTVHLRKED